MQIIDSEVPGRTGHQIPVRDYVPAHVVHPQPLLWVHGGGFMTGSLDMKESDAVARSIAESGRPVRTVDYRLVPSVAFRGKLKLKPSENRYPAPLHDVLDAYLDLAGGGELPFLGGASAGAGLSLSAALRLRDGDGVLPTGILLAYGTFHGRGAPISPELKARISLGGRALGILLGADPLQRMNINYAGSEDLLDDPGVFPGGGDLTGLPATLVINADRDTLRASGDAIAAELDRAGVYVTAGMLHGTFHGFLNKPKTDGFQDGVERFTAWMNELTTTDPSHSRESGPTE